MTFRKQPSLPQDFPPAFCDGESANAIHVDCIITRASTLLPILRARASLVVYEPVPPSYIPANLELFRAAMPLVNIFSPSLEELRWLFDDKAVPLAPFLFFLLSSPPRFISPPKPQK